MLCDRSRFSAGILRLHNQRGSSEAGLLLNEIFTQSLRDERRNRSICIERLTTGGEIGQCVSFLLLTAQEHRQHRRDEATAPRTLRTKTDFAP
jgi:hypothetical protein